MAIDRDGGDGDNVAFGSQSQLQGLLDLHFGRIGGACGADNFAGGDFGRTSPSTLQRS
jgi:hypothetical protein